jgi:hypothetical protein
VREFGGSQERAITPNRNDEIACLCHGVAICGEDASCGTGLRSKALDYAFKAHLPQHCEHRVHGLQDTGFLSLGDDGDALEHGGARKESSVAHLAPRRKRPPQPERNASASGEYSRDRPVFPDEADTP